MKKPRFDNHINAEVYTMKGAMGKPVAPKSKKPGLKKNKKMC